jgi:hypothetical protein
MNKKEIRIMEKVRDKIFAEKKRFKEPVCFDSFEFMAVQETLKLMKEGI